MAEYQMQELTFPGEEGKKVFYPRVKVWSQTDLEELVKRINYASSFTPGDVMGLIKALTQAVAAELSLGHTVKIDGLGVFSLSLGVRKGFEPETGKEGEQKRNAQSICVKRINFRADRKLVTEVAQRCDLSRSKSAGRRSSQRYTEDERLKLAQEYLEAHPVMQVADYCRLTGLLRNAAALELKRWSETPGTGIGSVGVRTHKMYVKVQPQADAE